MKMFDTPNPEPPLVEQPREVPPVTHPTRSTYDREVGEVKDNVLRMGALVEACGRQALRAIERGRIDHLG